MTIAAPTCYSFIHFLQTTTSKQLDTNVRPLAQCTRLMSLPNAIANHSFTSYSFGRIFTSGQNLQITINLITCGKNSFCRFFVTFAHLPINLNPCSRLTEYEPLWHTTQSLRAKKMMRSLRRNSGSLASCYLLRCRCRLATCLGSLATCYLISV